MSREYAEAEMTEGYCDGGDLDAPEPSANRSASYRHGFAVRRAEVSIKKPLAPAAVLRVMAAEAIEKDASA